MASTSAAEPSSAKEETPNWLEMPHEIMMLILQRLGAVEILISTQKVCTTWRRICKDPAMWKVIDMHQSFDVCDTDYDIEQLAKQAVHRSCGELIDISLECFGSDDLLDHISRCSSKLNRLRLTNCYGITGCGLNNALKRLPHLEALKLSYISICAEDIEVIGRNCPQLKSLKMKTNFMGCDGDAHAIANSMPALRHLKLVGSTMDDNDDGVRAILNGCPHLESLDLCGCFYLHLDGNLEKLCRERIKDFKFKRNNIPQGYGESESDVDLSDDAIDDFFDGIGIDDYGSSISAEDDYDYYWPAFSAEDNYGYYWPASP